MDTVYLSLTYNGHQWSTEAPMEYGTVGEYDKRFIAMRLGYVNNYFAFRFRWQSEYRMAFSVGNIIYS